jgi:hypothetical protein
MYIQNNTKQHYIEQGYKYAGTIIDNSLLKEDVEMFAKIISLNNKEVIQYQYFIDNVTTNLIPMCIDRETLNLLSQF